MADKRKKPSAAASQYLRPDLKRILDRQAQQALVILFVVDSEKAKKLLWLACHLLNYKFNNKRLTATVDWLPVAQLAALD